jgi:hypothetical protein
MLYGIIFRSQYQFVASVPLVALGATICLTLPLALKELQTLRVIPVIIIAAVLLMPIIVGGIYIFGPFGGSSPMNMGIMGDRIYWDDALNWIGTQPKNTVSLTWWDYGHWISAVSDRISIADNTKAERFMVKDLARFHVVTESETEALEIARKYNSTYVVIDYTMIGKSGAPHFIATSEFGEPIPIKKLGARMSCEYASDCANAIDGERYAATQIDRRGSVTIDLTTYYDINSITLKVPLGQTYGYLIESSLDGLSWRKLVENTTRSMVEKNSFSTVKARYLKVTGTSAESGNEFRFTLQEVYNPRKEGSGQGYAQCQYSPANSLIKPTPEQNSEGGWDMVSKLVFICNNGLGIVFEVKNGVPSYEDTYIVYQNAQRIPWSTWMSSTNASLLGVQSINSILGNALNYPDNYANFPTFTTLVYVPSDGTYNFNKVMMTKLYLGDHLEEYQNAGLASGSIEKPKYFSLVDGFLGDKQDHSYWGYVKIYKVNYPDETSQASS